MMMMRPRQSQCELSMRSDLSHIIINYRYAESSRYIMIEETINSELVFIVIAYDITELERQGVSVNMKNKDKDCGGF